jgi:hypothetical protein
MSEKSIFKKGVRFPDEEQPIHEAEVPLIFQSLSETGRRRAAIAGLIFIQHKGWSIRKIRSHLETSKQETPT